jgi:hypothetical protein
MTLILALGFTGLAFLGLDALTDLALATLGLFGWVWQLTSWHFLTAVVLVFLLGALATFFCLVTF